MDSLSEEDDDPEPEVFVDPLAIAAARQAQLSKLQVKEVQALIHVLVMAAQGHMVLLPRPTRPVTFSMSSSRRRTYLLQKHSLSEALTPHPN